MTNTIRRPILDSVLACHTPLRPKAGDCYVFWAHDCVPCPSSQVESRRGCCTATDD